jgi:hypothetical protein
MEIKIKRLRFPDFWASKHIVIAKLFAKRRLKNRLH